MCAGTNEKDACQGDSGGPLHLEGKDKKTDLIGTSLCYYFTLNILILMQF